MKSRTYYLHTLGCKVNSYETNALGFELSSLGLEQVKTIEDADIIILNTCSVTGRADQKSRQHISQFRRKNENAILLVMGCYSQSHAQEAADHGASIVLGSSGRKKALGYIQQYEETHEVIIDVKKNVRHEQYEELGAASICENARAYLKIQDGCDNFCSYCFIPQLRGNSRSRDPREVLEECQSLIARGYKEIVITGIHIGGYGKDLGDGSFRFSQLLGWILSKCPDLFRLRISSIEESEIDEAFLRLLKQYPNIADHLHIPLQSGSSSVLARMKRKYDTEAFLKKLSLIREIRPDIAITTDVIVGFPGETEEEWQETLSFCRRANFAEIHVFPFSSRPGTYAATLKDTPADVKKRRVAELLALSRENREEYKKRFYGRSMEVLFEDFDPKEKQVKAHTSNYLLISLPCEHARHGEVDIVEYKSEISSD